MLVNIELITDKNVRLRIIGTAVRQSTPSKSADYFETADNYAVFLNSKYCVFGAARLENTTKPHLAGSLVLIQMYHPDSSPFHYKSHIQNSPYDRNNPGNEQSSDQYYKINYKCNNRFFIGDLGSVKRIFNKLGKLTVNSCGNSLNLYFIAYFR